MARDKIMLGLVGITSVSAVALGQVSQHVFDMPPCAWCVFQRLIYLSLGLVCAAGSLGHPTRLRTAVSAALATALGISGVLAAWYQVQVAANMFSCKQTLADQVITTLRLDEMMPWLFGIYATCMEAKVKVLGVEYGVWSLSLFVILGLTSMAALICATRGHRGQ